MLKTLTDFGNLALLLPLATIVTVWLITLRQPRAVVAWWLVALALCVGSTAALKIYFFVCPPLIDLHSPSGHTSLSTLVYGALTLAVATVVGGWKRIAVMAAGTAFVVAIGISRVAIQAHSTVEVLLGWVIGVAALAVFAARFWPYRPAEPRLQGLLVVSVALMVMLNGQDLHAEGMLHAIGVYLNSAGMVCF
jgi:membrane-associated phospholipid phosphatase